MRSPLIAARPRARRRPARRTIAHDRTAGARGLWTPVSLGRRPDGTAFEECNDDSTLGAGGVRPVMSSIPPRLERIARQAPFGNSQRNWTGSVYFRPSWIAWRITLLAGSPGVRDDVRPIVVGVGRTSFVAIIPGTNPDPAFRSVLDRPRRAIGTCPVEDGLPPDFVGGRLLDYDSEEDE